MYIHITLSGICGHCCMLYRDRPIMLIFYLLCYAAMLKFLTYYAQYYAHVETVLLEYIHLYHKILEYRIAGYFP